MRKTFVYGDRVRVKLPRREAIYGTVYSQYRVNPGRERTICVEVPSGSGIGYLVRYVTHARSAGR